MVEHSSIPYSEAQARAFDSIERKPGPIVLADGSGKWFRVFCTRCGLRGQALKDKKMIQERADKHAEVCR